MHQCFRCSPLAAMLTDSGLGRGGAEGCEFRLRPECAERPSDYKPRIAEAVREAAGRDLEIAGEISYALVPAIKFKVSDVHLSNAPGELTADKRPQGRPGAQAPEAHHLGRRHLRVAASGFRPVPSPSPLNYGMSR